MRRLLIPLILVGIAYSRVAADDNVVSACDTVAVQGQAHALHSSLIRIRCPGEQDELIRDWTLVAQVSPVAVAWIETFDLLQKKCAWNAQVCLGIFVSSAASVMVSQRSLGYERSIGLLALLLTIFGFNPTEAQM